jgi:hypothetical protein
VVSVVDELLNSCTDQPVPVPFGALEDTATWRCSIACAGSAPRSKPPPIARLPLGQATVCTALRPRLVPLLGTATASIVRLTTS